MGKKSMKHLSVVLQILFSVANFIFDVIYGFYVFFFIIIFNFSHGDYAKVPKSSSWLKKWVIELETLIPLLPNVCKSSWECKYCPSLLLLLLLRKHGYQMLFASPFLRQLKDFIVPFPQGSRIHQPLQMFTACTIKDLSFDINEVFIIFSFLYEKGVKTNVKSIIIYMYIYVSKNVLTYLLTYNVPSSYTRFYIAYFLKFSHLF